MSVATSKLVDTVSATVTTRAGWTRFNTHYHDSDSATLTNRTGGTTAAGDVVTPSTANDSSVVAADTLLSPRQFLVGVGSVNNLSAGPYDRKGIVLVKVTGAVVRGNYLIKSATAGRLEDSGVSHTNGFMTDNAVAIALQSNASGTATIKAFWLPVTWALGATPRSILHGVTTPKEFNLTGNVVLASLTVKGGWLSTNRKIRFRLIGTFFGSSGAVALFQGKYGNSPDSLLGGSNPVPTDERLVILNGELIAKDATNAQILWGATHDSTAESNGTSHDVAPSVNVGNHFGYTVDSTVDQLFKIEGIAVPPDVWTYRLHSLLFQLVPNLG